MNSGFGLLSLRFRSAIYRWRGISWEVVLEARIGDAECLVIGHVYILY